MIHNPEELKGAVTSGNNLHALIMELQAQRINAKADWNNLVLPAEQKALLHQLTDQVSCHNRFTKTEVSCSKLTQDWGLMHCLRV